MSGDEPAALQEILEQFPGARLPLGARADHGDLNDAALAHSDDGQPADDTPDETILLGEIHDLMLEVLRLAHASDALEAQLPVSFSSGQPTNLPPRDRARIKPAS